MSAGTWKVYTRAKRAIGTGSITLNAGVFKMALFRPSASANILKKSNGGISTYGSVPGEISATGGYATGGKALAAFGWTLGASATQMKFRYTTLGIVWTGALNNIKYALIRNSTGAGAGKALCFVTLSTAQFSVTNPNTLTISPAAAGVFTLA